MQLEWGKRDFSAKVRIGVLAALKVVTQVLLVSTRFAFLLSDTQKLSALLCMGVSMGARCSTKENQVPLLPRKTENCFACNRNAFYFPHPQPAFNHITSYR